MRGLAFVAEDLEGRSAGWWGRKDGREMYADVMDLHVESFGLYVLYVVQELPSCEYGGL